MRRGVFAYFALAILWKRWTGLCALGQYAVVDLTHYWSSAAQYKAAPEAK